MRAIEVLPDYIENEHQELTIFLEEYLKWLNSPNNVGHLLNNLIDYTDIDKCSDKYIEHIRKKLAVKLPSTIKANKRLLYVNLIDLYKSRGTVDSYKVLFNIIFGDDAITVYYPEQYILIPSNKDKGILSGSNKIQDSYFYQKFSYVLKSKQSLEKWSPIVKSILHPAGFKMFGVYILTNDITDLPREMMKNPQINSYIYWPYITWEKWDSIKGKNVDDIGIGEFVNFKYKELATGDQKYSIGFLYKLNGQYGVAIKDGTTGIADWDSAFEKTNIDFSRFQYGFNAWSSIKTVRTFIISTSNRFGPSLYHIDRVKFKLDSPISDYLDMKIDEYRTNRSITAEIRKANNAGKWDKNGKLL